jgi:phosphoribosylformylglycinamidine synthase
MDVPPTLVSFALCVTKAGRVISPEFKKPGNIITFVRTPADKNGIPDFAALLDNFATIEAGIASGGVVSARTAGFGGVGAAIAQMCFGNALGVDLTFPESELFAPLYGSFVLETEPGASVGERIGETADSGVIRINGAALPAAEVEAAWTSALEGVFPSGVSSGGAPSRPKPYTSPKSAARPCARLARPRVFIPVFPGTNTEYETAAAFEKAGAAADVFVLKNLSVSMLRESIAEMARRINEAQILMIPGGFSAGDEPGGSGKFIAAVFRNALLAESVSDLLDRRGGLALGICNGAQALVKLGLAPYGRISDITVETPTLTFNRIGRHVSTIAKVKVMSTLSPWLAGLRTGDTRSVAVSHGEGRFCAAPSIIERLIENGQIATCYVDERGDISNETPHNPNGSMFSIEGVTSPDGRVFAKMGHAERIGAHLYKNVPGDYDMKLFECGVAYFA